MQVQTKRVFFIKLDEDEAQEFLDDASDVQRKLREQMNGHVNGAQSEAVTLRAQSDPPSNRGRPAKHTALPNSSGRRAMKKVTCPDCKKQIAAHWLERHRQSQHAAAQNAAEPSAG